MLCDFDDFSEQDNRLDLLEQLHDANPAFRCTLFAIPALGSYDFWESVPEWCELAMHGWLHPTPRECEHWTYVDAVRHLDFCPRMFVKGFKAPGWQISDDTYRALKDKGWWVADHWENDHRRPKGIKAHVTRPLAASRLDPDHWHGHVGNVCNNGLEETFPQLLERVKQAESFELVSEVVEPW